MLGIMATGNYGTFNLLTIALCVTLLDDGHLPRSSSRRAPTPATPADGHHRESADDRALGPRRAADVATYKPSATALT